MLTSSYKNNGNIGRNKRGLLSYSSQRIESETRSFKPRPFSFGGPEVLGNKQDTQPGKLQLNP